MRDLHAVIMLKSYTLKGRGAQIFQGGANRPLGPPERNIAGGAENRTFLSLAVSRANSIPDRLHAPLFTGRLQ